MGIQKLSVPRYSGSLSIEGCTYRVSVHIAEGPQAGEEVPVHNHPQYELLLFPKGSTVIQAGGQSYPLQPGDCCLLQPLAYHLRHRSADTAKFCTLVIQAAKGSPLEMLQQPCLVLQCAKEILQHFSALEQELETPRLGTQNNVQALLCLILVALLRELAEQVPQPQQTPPRTALARYEDIIDDYIALHYARELRVGELAEKAGITTRHLARIMQQSYGCTFRQHLLKIRLYYARYYLETTHLPVSQIAMQCGFVAESAFCAAFRKNIGCTPRAYRKAHQK